MTARICQIEVRIDPNPAWRGHRHVRSSAVASTAGGGWNSQIPTPGGVVERNRPQPRAER
jgi:hypothetical protein